MKSIWATFQPLAITKAYEKYIFNKTMPLCQLRYSSCCYVSGMTRYWMLATFAKARVFSASTEAGSCNKYILLVYLATSINAFSTHEVYFSWLLPSADIGLQLALIKGLKLALIKALTVVCMNMPI